MTDFSMSDFGFILLKEVQMDTDKNRILRDELREFNTLWKAQDDIWQAAAKKSGLPENAFWILYVIVIEENPELTQAELCKAWFIPRQTCNSAVKKLEKEGILTLQVHRGAGNVKYLALTEKGRGFADKYISPLTTADMESFSSFTDEERKLLLSLMQRQLDNLKKGTALNQGE